MRKAHILFDLRGCSPSTTGSYLWLALALLLIGQPLCADDQLPTEFFENEVLPILQQRCLECHSHSSGTMKGGLALDWKSGWSVGGDSGPAIVPGKPAESLLIEAIKRQGFEMPPDETLPSAEISTLVKWIELGATDPRVAEPQVSRPTTDWWSLRPLKRPEVPQAETGTHPVDAFIDAKLHEAGLTRSQPADRRTLIRRLFYDLHGLPPTHQQVEDFVADESSDSIERLIASLLESPRYGERWARHWLDVVHFADTHGCEHDVFRPHAWRYRDYVIDAFNRDLPWQDFIRQQLAADHFFPEESHLTAALGFLGAGPFDSSSASTAPVTFDYMDRDDLVTQTMAAFVSTTANCARCHAHKFDPITQEDYYSLQAVFAGVGKGDRNYDADPVIYSQRKQWQSVLAAISTNQTELLLSVENQERVAAWEEQHSGDPVEWKLLPVDIFLSSGGAELTRLADGSILAGGTRPDVETYTFTTSPQLKSITALRLEVLTDESLPFHGPGRQDNGNLHLTEVVTHLFIKGKDKSQRLVISQATADFNQAGWTISHALDNNVKTAWGIYPEVDKPHFAVFEFAKPVQVEEGSQLFVMLKQLHGAGHVLGRSRLSITNAPVERVSVLPREVRVALELPTDQRTVEQQLAIAKHALTLIANQELSSLPAPVQVYAASANFNRGKRTASPIAPKVVHLLSRGDIEKPLEVVHPGALSAIEQLSGRFEISPPNDEVSRRAALADWIATQENPLTWRSIANRVWQFHFSEGLCNTPSDFGRMGGTPSHPELLDWLACELRERNGSLKHLHQLVLTSQTYQQSAQFREAAAAIDGSNRLHWRANRSRLDAESFFDSVLQVSGRLNLKMGGAGVQHFTLTPGQQTTPQVHYDRFEWSKPEGARRAIYRVVWRGIPDPLFEMLDFPDLGLLSPQRSFSVSALQSLTLWNHPFILHHCEVMAQELQDQHADLEGQLRAAFAVILLRPPTTPELEMVSDYCGEFGLAAGLRLLLNSNEFLFVN